MAEQQYLPNHLKSTIISDRFSKKYRKRKENPRSYESVRNKKRARKGYADDEAEEVGGENSDEGGELSCDENDDPSDIYEELISQRDHWIPTESYDSNSPIAKFVDFFVREEFQNFT